MPDPAIRSLLEEIHSAVLKILSYTGDMAYEKFLQNEKTIDAVVRNFEIISDAANKIPGGFTTEHPGVEWQAISGFRNAILPDDFNINFDYLWKIKLKNLPTLAAALQQILARQNETD